MTASHEVGLTVVATAPKMARVLAPRSPAAMKLSCNRWGARLWAPLLLLATVGVASAPRSVAADTGIRGPAFEIGAVGGGGLWSSNVGVDPCPWFGLKIGHRFAPFSPKKRAFLGFRAGWEGCFTEENTAGGAVDMIYVNFSLLYGIRIAKPLLLHWSVGMGMLLADATKADGDIDPRLSGHMGPGATVVIGEHFLIDLSVLAIIFQNLEFTDSKTSAFGIVPTLMIGAQI